EQSFIQGERESRRNISQPQPRDGNTCGGVTNVLLNQVQMFLIHRDPFKEVIDEFVLARIPMKRFRPAGRSCSYRSVSRLSGSLVHHWCRDQRGWWLGTGLRCLHFPANFLGSEWRHGSSAKDRGNRDKKWPVLKI